MSRLHNAAESGDVEAVREGIATGMDVNAVGFRGTTPLQIAAWYGFPKVVRELIQAGADPSLAPHGSPPLIIAARFGHLAAVKVLVEAGADITATQGEPSWIKSAILRYDEVVAYLREQGASLDIPSSQAKAALDCQAVESVQRESQKPFEQRERDIASPEAADCVRRIMAKCATPEEYAGKYGQGILIFGYGSSLFEDKAVEQWAHRLREILSDAALFAECEEKYLTREELEALRKMRERHEKANARRKRQDALRAARMQDE